MKSLDTWKEGNLFMTKAQYERLSKPYQNSRFKSRALVAADKLITMLVFFSYPVFLIYMGVTHSPQEFVRAVIIPTVSFLLVSVFRKWYSAPRPYEVLDIKPILVKDTKGKSFPSRHVFSVFVIGMACFYTVKLLGAAICLLGMILACIRVIGGVHFPKDVIAGALLGIAAGLFFWIS